MHNNNEHHTIFDHGLQLRTHVDVLGDVVDELLGPEDLCGNDTGGRFVEFETLTLASFINRKTRNNLIAEACLDLIMYSTGSILTISRVIQPRA